MTDSSSAFDDFDALLSALRALSDADFEKRSTDAQPPLLVEVIKLPATAVPTQLNDERPPDAEAHA